jgi:hypothetical protein
LKANLKSMVSSAKILLSFHKWLYARGSARRVQWNSSHRSTSFSQLRSLAKLLELALARHFTWKIGLPVVSIPEHPQICENLPWKIWCSIAISIRSSAGRILKPSGRTLLISRHPTKMMIIRAWAPRMVLFISPDTSQST